MIDHPIRTRTEHELPFERLSPRDFERLCLGLVRREGYKDVQHLGAAGSEQGRDIIALRQARRVAFQCKRVRKFGPAAAQKELEKILALVEAERPDELIFLVTCDVRALTRKKTQDSAGSIVCSFWALTELDERVRGYPDLAAQFFGSDPSDLSVGAALPPAIPEHYLERSSDLAEIRRAVLTGTETRLALHGMGGIGKTVLAAAVAWDPEVLAAFPDGVRWLSVGQEQTDLLALLGELARAEHDPGPLPARLSEARNRVRALLAGRQVLLVLDDVWTREDAAALDVIVPPGRLLVTTRNDQIALGLGARVIPLEVLDPAGALALLAAWAGVEDPARLPAVAGRVAEECGFLPLALAMAGALAAQPPISWDDILERLRRADLEKLRRYFDYAHPNLLRALEVSVEALDPGERERYLELAVFPEDTPIPLPAIETLWSAAGLDALDARERIADLVGRSLARLADDRLTLHDLQRDYLRKRAGDLRPLHQRLVEAYAARCPDGFAAGPNDGWFFQRLPWHLREAGRVEELRALLLSVPWLEAKLRATDVNTVLGDLAFLPDDEGARQVQEFLRGTAHILEREPSQLSGQFLARFQEEDVPDLKPILAAAAVPRPGLRLRPMRPTLAPPGPLLRTLRTGSGWVLAVAVLDSRRVVSLGGDRRLRVWDLERGECLRTLAEQVQEGTALAVLGCGRVATGGWDRSVQVWDLASGDLLRELCGHRDTVRALAAFADGRLVSTSDDGTLRVWNPDSGDTLAVLEGHGGSVNAVAALDSGLLISASDDRTLRIWDAGEAVCRGILRGHTDPVLSVACLDGRTFVSGAADSTLRVWNVETRSCSHVVEVGGGATSLAALDGQHVVAGFPDATLRAWDLTSEEPPALLKGHTDSVRSVAKLDSRHAISASTDGTLRIWEVGQKRRSFENSEAEIRFHGGHAGEVTALSHLEGRRVVSASRDGTLRVWDLASGKTVHVLGDPGPRSPVAGVAVLGGSRVVAASRQALRVWNAELGTVLRNFRQPSRSAVVGLCALDDHRFVVANWGGALLLWDDRQGKPLRVFGDPEGRLAAAVTLDRSRILTGSESAVLRVWDVESGGCLRTLKDGRGAIGAVAALDPSRAVSGSDDGTIRVWDIDREKHLVILEGHEAAVKALAVIDARRLLSGAADHTLRVWDVEAGQTLDLFTLDAPVTSLLVQPDRCTVVAGDSRGAVHFFTLEESNL